MHLLLAMSLKLWMPVFEEIPYLLIGLLLVNCMSLVICRSLFEVVLFYHIGMVGLLLITDSIFTNSEFYNLCRIEV